MEQQARSRWKITSRTENIPFAIGWTTIIQGGEEELYKFISLSLLCLLFDLKEERTRGVVCAPNLQNNEKNRGPKIVSLNFSAFFLLFLTLGILPTT